jgi:hypothetical protein
LTYFRVKQRPLREIDPTEKKARPPQAVACYGELGRTNRGTQGLGGATVAIIAQKRLFGWQDIEGLGDLQRLKLVIDSLPDEGLMVALEAQRGKRGRDDFPVRPMWNAVLAGAVFQHPTIESLRRELARNGQLRQLCGFWPRKNRPLVPNAWAFCRFLASVVKQEQLLKAMFARLVKDVAGVLPDYGQHLAIDGKALASYARGRSKAEEQPTERRLEPDGRRDTDGEWGVHEQRGQREDGSAWEKITRWFGYTLNLIVDTRYELPVAFSVTKANSSEVVEAHRLLKQAQEDHPFLIERCESLAADRGYDDVKLIREVWESWQALAIVDIRNCWRDGETTKLVEGAENIVYDYRGTISCVCPRTGTQHEMAYAGLERERGTLKYRCPASHYGIQCAGRDKCPIGKAVRIPMAQEPRVFTPLPRNTYKWKRLYAGRTAVERVNSRLDNVYGFENHTIRGMAKMRMRCTLALAVMLAMALGRIRAQQPQKMRSLVRPAA